MAPTAAVPPPVSPIMAGLLDHRVSAQVKDLDHYRIHGGMAVETDFIIHVKCVNTGTKTRLEPDFEKFIISKTFSAFRVLADQLHAAANAVMDVHSNNNDDDRGRRRATEDDVPIKVKNLANYCETVFQLIESQRTQYLGKVNFMYVKILAKQRSQIISDVLETTLSHFPDEIESHYFLATVAKLIEAFFLTDHAVSPEEDAKDEASTFLFMTPRKKHYATIKEPKIRLSTTTADEGTASPGSQDSGIEDNDAPDAVNLSSRHISSPVVPISRKVRRSAVARQNDTMELKKSGESANLLLDDDRTITEMVPNYSAPYPTVGSSLGTSYLGSFIDNNPFMFMVIFVVSALILRSAGRMVVTVDFDILLLVIFASFCVGLHTPRPMVGGIDKPPLVKRRGGRRSDHSGFKNAAKLLRRSMIASPRSLSPVNESGGDSNAFFGGEAQMEAVEAEVQEDEDDVCIRSPMPRFPEGAPLGSELNCWSDPPFDTFKVRGDTYLTDSKKVKSGPFIFKSRGIDLFLTDDCPENVGRISGVMGGDLRDVPTFMINFRLPWGVLVFYYEIPEKFLPFILGCYNDPSVDKAELESQIAKMNNQDRCCARWLLGNDDHKNKTLKIFPVVVEGPWVVKSVVGGKPAIIGTKMPVNYVYEPAGKTSDGKKQALYLEADLDIVSSSAARGILSVTRTYTQDLTLDLGFAIQGNSNDELREQMLVGTRLHGIDPLNAPALPPMKDLFKMSEAEDEDDDDNST